MARSPPRGRALRRQAAAVHVGPGPRDAPHGGAARGLPAARTPRRAGLHGLRLRSRPAILEPVRRRRRRPPLPRDGSERARAARRPDGRAPHPVDDARALRTAPPPDGRARLGVVRGGLGRHGPRRHDEGRRLPAALPPRPLRLRPAARVPRARADRAEGPALADRAGAAARHPGDLARALAPPRRGLRRPGAPPVRPRAAAHANRRAHGRGVAAPPAVLVLPDPGHSGHVAPGRPRTPVARPGLAAAAPAGRRPPAAPARLDRPGRRLFQPEPRQAEPLRLPRAPGSRSRRGRADRRARAAPRPPVATPAPRADERRRLVPGLAGLGRRRALRGRASPSPARDHGQRRTPDRGRPRAGTGPVARGAVALRPEPARALRLPRGRGAGRARADVAPRAAGPLAPRQRSLPRRVLRSRARPSRRPRPRPGPLSGRHGRGHGSVREPAGPAALSVPVGAAPLARPAPRLAPDGPARFPPPPPDSGGRTPSRPGTPTRNCAKRFASSDGTPGAPSWRSRFDTPSQKGETP